MATSIEPETVDMLQTYMKEAQRARADYLRAAADFRRFFHRETELTDTRHVAKQAACLRLKGIENPLTAPKPYSGSSAEDYAETDAEYAAHLRELRDIVFDKLAAAASMVDAKMRQREALVAVHALLGGAE